MKKKFPCIEATLDIKINSDLTYNKLIRLWIDVDEVKNDYGNKSLANKIRQFTENNQSYSDLVDFIKKEVPRVNAIQIKDNSGDVSYGVVVYYVDFDIKG